MRQRRLFLIRLFAAIAAFFFLSINLLFPQPTYGMFSSLDTPAGAEIAAYEASTVAAPSVGASSTASAIISETGAKTSGEFVGDAFIGVSVIVAGLVVAGLTSSNVQTLQGIAQQKYCAANPSASVCMATGNWHIVYDLLPSGSDIAGNLADNLHFVLTSNKYGCSNWVDLVSDVRGVVVPEWGCYTPYPYSGISITFNKTSDTLPWKNWDSASRNAAVSLLTPSDYQQNNTETSTQALTGDTTDPSLTIVGTGTSGAFVQNSDGSWTYQSSNSFIIPNPNYIPSPTPTTSPSPSPSPTPSPSPSAPTGSGGSPSPTPSPTPSPSPDPSPSPNSDCAITDDMWRDLEDINNPKVGDPTTPAGRTISKHAEESLQRHGFQEPYSDVDDIIDNYSRQSPQADLATAYIKANKDDTYNLAIVNKQDGRIVTAMKDLSLKALKRLGERYGFDPNP